MKLLQPKYTGIFSDVSVATYVYIYLSRSKAVARNAKIKINLMKHENRTLHLRNAHLVNLVIHGNEHY